MKATTYIVERADDLISSYFYSAVECRSLHVKINIAVLESTRYLLYIKASPIQELREKSELVFHVP